MDCEFSQTRWAWRIPPEAHGHLGLFLWAEDTQNPRWSMGLVRTTIDHLDTGGNRYATATLNKAGRQAINWLFDGARLPSNLLSQLDNATVQRIVGQKSAQKRVNELFRSATGRIVARPVVATVARQNAYMKCVRAKGAAPTALKEDGIIILGQGRSHAAIARALGLPVPGHGDLISARIAPAAAINPGVVEIDGRLWRLATPADPPVTAPTLPKI